MVGSDHLSTMYQAPTSPATPATDRPAQKEAPGVDGDASTHLEELLVEQAVQEVGALPEGPTVAVELVGPHLRLSGTIGIGFHRRLSDFINHHEGLIKVHDATVLRRNGDPTKVTMPSVWVSPEEVTLIGQVEDDPNRDTRSELWIEKVAKPIIVVTPGHTMTADVHITPQAELSAFIESPSPVYVPMTDVRSRSLADRRVISRYAFALLNRRHMVAATKLQPGMVAGKSVL